MLKVLHLSDTPLSGSPLRIARLQSAHGGIDSRHIVYNKKFQHRDYGVDILGCVLQKDEVIDWLNWADVVHYHNRYARQEIFTAHGLTPPQKLSVIQMHSPRDSEDFRPEMNSKIPLAIVAQYHPRQWPELSFIVPNVVDIYAEAYTPVDLSVKPPRPVISYAPSSTNGCGWDDKGYGVVAPVLKRLHMKSIINFDIITQAPFSEVLLRKRNGCIGIDEVVTGSYHLSGLEYLAMGIPCFAGIDEKTTKVLLDLTGAESQPFLKTSAGDFKYHIQHQIDHAKWAELGAVARQWMERYWNPKLLCGHYQRMYEKL